MFQLIVAVISIALVAALAIASIFYGGDAFTRSSERANVTALVNQAQQIAGAATLYKTDNAIDAPNVAALVSGEYLATVPSAPKLADEGDGWFLTPGVDVRIELNTGATSICDVDGEVSKQAGDCEVDGAATYFTFAL